MEWKFDDKGKRVGKDGKPAKKEDEDDDEGPVKKEGKKKKADLEEKPQQREWSSREEATEALKDVWAFFPLGRKSSRIIPHPFHCLPLFQLMEESTITPSTSWKDVVKTLQGDVRFHSMLATGEKKNVFEEFKRTFKKREEERKREKIRKARENFTAMLQESKEITKGSSWSEVKAKFEDDDRYKEIDSSRDREDLFRDFVWELDKNEKERKKQAEEAFLAMLRETTSITGETSLWEVEVAFLFFFFQVQTPR